MRLVEKQGNEEKAHRVWDGQWLQDYSVTMEEVNAEANSSGGIPDAARARSRAEG